MDLKGRRELYDRIHAARREEEAVEASRREKEEEEAEEVAAEEEAMEDLEDEDAAVVTDSDGKEKRTPRTTDAATATAAGCPFTRDDDNKVETTTVLTNPLSSSSSSNERMRMHDLEDPLAAPPLETFQVPTEPLKSQVSSMYTLPELYHGINMYPAVDPILAKINDQEVVALDDHAPMDLEKELDSGSVDTMPAKDQEVAVGAPMYLRKELDGGSDLESMFPTTKMEVAGASLKRGDLNGRLETSSQGSDCVSQDEHIQHLEKSGQMQQVMGSLIPPPLPTLLRHSRALGSTVSTSLPGAHAVGGPSIVMVDSAPEQSVPEGDPEQPQPQPQPPAPLLPCIEGATLVVEDDGDLSTTGTRTANCTLSCESATFYYDSQQPRPSQQRYHDSSSSGQSSSTKRCWFYAIATALFAASIAVIGILLTTSSSNNNSSNNTNSSVPYNFHELLRSQTIEAIQSDNDYDPNGGAFARANLWMLRDPYRTEYTPMRQRQRFVLAWFYFVTGGSNWTRNDRWLSYTVSECDWHNDRASSKWVDDNVPTCTSSQELQVLSLPDNNLRGTMPYFYETLPSLRFLDIGYNRVAGVIPALSRLEINVISHNQFEGLGVQIGGGGGSGTQLLEEDLKLRVNVYDGNRFDSYWTGAIFPLWKELQVLNGTDNRNLRGFIAPTIQHCTSLTYFGIGGTNIGGKIPSQFGLLTNLQEVYLAGSSKLRGTLPSQFGLLSKLTHLDITGTSLTGKVPEPLCHRIHPSKDDDDDPGEAPPSLTLVANCSALECCGE